MILPCRRGGVEEERDRLDGMAQRRLLHRPLRGLRVAVEEQRAAVQREDVARRRGARRDALERLERFWQRIAARRREIQPDATERAVDDRLVGRALEQVPERHDREIAVPGARVRESDGDLTFHTIAIQSRENLQLFQLLLPPALRRVQVRELFTRRNERR